jgi:hypothetical protein
MKTNTIYILGGIAVAAGLVVIGYRNGWFGEKKSNAIGKCNRPTKPYPKDNIKCEKYVWDKNICDWVCAVNFTYGGGLNNQEKIKKITI